LTDNSCFIKKVHKASTELCEQIKNIYSLPLQRREAPEVLNQPAEKFLEVEKLVFDNSFSQTDNSIILPGGF